MHRLLKCCNADTGTCQRRRASTLYTLTSMAASSLRSRDRCGVTRPVGGACTSRTSDVRIGL